MSILSKIKSFFYRPPDVIIGFKEGPYLHRWHIIPRNKWFNIYLHKFLRKQGQLKDGPPPLPEYHI